MTANYGLWFSVFLACVLYAGYIYSYAAYSNDIYVCARFGINYLRMSFDRGRSEQ